MSLDGWKAFFEIGGVVLLLLTFAFGAGALIVNNRLNKIQAQELGDFRIRFEEEQQKTALAQKEASEAKEALIRLTTPRTLSVFQQANIATRLRSFGTRRVDVIIIGDAREIADIAGAIIAAFEQAGWAVKYLGKAISGPNVTGVLVGTHAGSDSAVNQAADALISALQSEEIVSGRFMPQFNDELPMALMGDIWDVKNIAPIRVLISAKP